MHLSIALAVALVAFPPPGSPPANASLRQIVVEFSPRAREFVRTLATRNPSPHLDEHLAALGVFRIARLAERSPGALAGSQPPRGFDPARTWLLEAPDTLAADSAIAVLARDPDVLWVERNRPREAAVVTLATPGPVARAGIGRNAAAEFPNDPCFVDSRQWGLENRGPGSAYGGLAGADVAARAAWRMTTGTRDVVLALADTGIDPAHPELADTLADGSTRIIESLDLVTGTPDARDGYGHGTAVAGVMAARTGEGAHFDSLGVAGVCGGDGLTNPGCRIVPIKITLDTTGVTTSWLIAQAILHATDAGARAVNLSFSGGGDSRLERLALAEAIARGTVVVTASGNHGFRAGDTPQYPAAHAAEGLCIQVGASDPWDRRAAFSSYGPGLDLVAPGTDVWTTFMTYPTARGYAHAPYVAASGTSFAAPFVTGAVGLLAAARPELGPSDFQHVLRESAHDVGAPGVDPETGFGRLDLAAALTAVHPGIGIWHDEVAADSFREIALDTLTLPEPGFGTLERAGTWPDARAFEVTATVAIPDTFLDSIRIWPRVAGTTTVRGDFRLPYVVPWAAVTRSGPSFTLKGYAYRVDHAADGDSDGTWMPLPRDQLRFGFTVLGRVKRSPGPGVGVPDPAPKRELRAAPNPFRSITRIRGASPCTIDILDVTGRRVRAARLDGSLAEFVWDGRDRSGRRLPAGLYLIRAASPQGPASLKVLKLE